MVVPDEDVVAAEDLEVVPALFVEVDARHDRELRHLVEERGQHGLLERRTMYDLTFCMLLL